MYKKMLLVLLFSTIAHANDWIPLKADDGSRWEIDPSTVQRRTKIDPSAPNNIPVILVRGIWVKPFGAQNKAASMQVWIDCGGRQVQTYNTPNQGMWSAWSPIPAETMQWAVWNYLCKPPAKQKAAAGITSMNQ
jgi:hypothetical protein